MKAVTQSKILEELAKNEKNVKIGDEVFNVAITDEDMKVGLPLEEVIEEMKKASKENLLDVKNDAIFC
jgi:hypothetical protein